MMTKISCIVPCYNEEASLPFFYDAIVAVMAQMEQEYGVEFEVIYVNDGSCDDTLAVMRMLKEKDTRMRYISFSRNFGKEAAMYAGMEAAVGDYVVVMDADLQHPPENLRVMYDIVKTKEYDCAAYRRVSRQGEPQIRSFFAGMFYKLINRISDTEIVDGATDYRMMSRPMVDAILSMKEYNRFSKGIFSWVGFRTKWLEYVNVERVAGETKWSFWSLLMYSFEGIIGFSTAPLALASFGGAFFCIISFLWLISIVIKTAIWGDPVAGFPTLACMMLLLGGIQLLCIGILGQYLAKMYLEVKNRPIYIIEERG